MNFKCIRLLGLCFLLTSCGFFSKTYVDERTESVYPAPDPEIAFLLDTYRDSLEDVMGRKVVTVTDTLRFGKPEGTLNNLVADALRFRAAAELRQFVHVGVIDEESFRIYFVPGELTVGDVYEFMPYDNHLVVLTLKGSAVMEIIEQVAEQGGAPISGIRFRIDENGTPNSVLVNSEVIDLDREYMVATSSWAANGGGRYSALWKAEERRNLGIPLKDVYVDYFRNQVELSNATDGRIRQ